MNLIWIQPEKGLTHKWAVKMWLHVWYSTHQRLASRAGLSIGGAQCTQNMWQLHSTRLFCLPFLSLPPLLALFCVCFLPPLLLHSAITRAGSHSVGRAPPPEAFPPARIHLGCCKKEPPQSPSPAFTRSLPFAQLALPGVEQGRARNLQNASSAPPPPPLHVWESQLGIRRGGRGDSRIPGGT